MTKTANEIEKLKMFEEINVPSGLISYLEKRTERKEYIRTGRYSVTDLVGCQRKNYYRLCGLEVEELLNDRTIENMWDSVRGELLHKITYSHRWREMDIEHNFVLHNGREVKIVGRLDMYDWKTGTIIDLKTTKFVKWQIKQGFIPKPEHLLQLQCYDFLFSAIIPVKNLNVVYADMSDIVAFKIRRRNLREWIKIRIQRVENCLNSNEVPHGEVSGLCKYCRYQTRCHTDGDGLITRPLSVPKSNE